MRVSYFIILCFLISFYGKTDANYVVEVHGTIKEVNTHQYTEKDNLKFLTINGTFKDNLGNFGQTNSLVYMLTKNNIVEKLESHNEFLYDNNTLSKADLEFLYKISKKYRIKTNDRHKYDLVNELLNLLLEMDLMDNVN